MTINCHKTEASLGLSAVADSLSGELIYPERGEPDYDLSFCSLTIDSRKVQAGDVYVAIRGERLDGHDFVQQAMEKGAICCVVDHWLADLKQNNAIQLVVKDTKLALGQIARLWREQFPVQLIAITGSCGKTTLKEMIVAVLLTKFPGQVLSTKGNLNNEYGVPLTLMQLSSQHRIAVIEMGANHMGEIAYLSALAKPDIAVVTNAGNAHIEGFGSLDGVASGKGEIYSALSDQGFAVINNDDNYASYWKEINKSRLDRIKTFAINNEADVKAEKDSSGQNVWKIKTEKAETQLELPVPGEHNILNALAATAVCQLIGVEIEQIANALQNFKNISGRLEVSSKQTCFTLIDDTYNANPDSVKAAIDVLSAYPDSRKTVLIIGDMAELGEQQQQMHHQIGEYAAKKNINQMFAVGNLTLQTIEGFNQYTGSSNRSGQYFNTMSELLKNLNTADLAGSVVLVKGSRMMAMEKVVQTLEKNC